LPNYRFTYGYPRFYPAIQDDQGKSLMAEPGQVYDLAAPPDDGWWVGPLEDAPPPPEAVFPDPGPAPELPQAAPEPVPVPEPAPPAPEPAPAPEAPAEPVPALESEAAKPFVFPGLTPFNRV
jgi:hypothetical protein